MLLSCLEVEEFGSRQFGCLFGVEGRQYVVVDVPVGRVVGRELGRCCDADCDCVGVEYFAVVVFGFFGKGMMVKPFEDVAFAIAQNEISEILETQFGYHIIVKTGEEAGHTPTLDEIRDKVTEFVFHAKRGQAVSDHVAELRAKADVKLS